MVEHLCKCISFLFHLMAGMALNPSRYTPTSWWLPIHCLSVHQDYLLIEWHPTTMGSALSVFCHLVSDSVSPSLSSVVCFDDFQELLVYPTGISSVCGPLHSPSAYLPSPLFLNNVNHLILSQETSLN